VRQNESRALGGLLDLLCCADHEKGARLRSGILLRGMAHAYCAHLHPIWGFAVRRQVSLRVLFDVSLCVEHLLGFPEEKDDRPNEPDD